MKKLMCCYLLSCLSRKKVKGKKNFMWSDKMRELKDLVSLILKKEGNWTSKKVKSKPQHVFEDTEGKFIINWWTSSKTLTLRAIEQKTSEKNS